MQTTPVRPGAVILGEATGGDLCTGHRGRAELAVEIHGVLGHASAPEHARNPNHVLPHVLLALRELSDAQPRHPVLGPATLTPTVVECWPKSGNVVPDRLRVILDLRVLPGWDEARALDEIRTLLAAAGRAPRVPGVADRLRALKHRGRSTWERPRFASSVMTARWDATPRLQEVHDGRDHEQDQDGPDPDRG